MIKKLTYAILVLRKKKKKNQIAKTIKRQIYKLIFGMYSRKNIKQRGNKE